MEGNLNMYLKEIFNPKLVPNAPGIKIYRSNQHGNTKGK